MPTSGSVWRRALPYVAMIGAFVAVVGYVLAVRPGEPTAGVSPQPTATFHGDGLSDSHDGYLMRAVSLPVARGRQVPIAFQIVGPTGMAHRDYELVQTQPMHLYLIRDDLSGYQHLHPALDADVWRASMDILDGGAYRLYAEFAPKGRGVVPHPITLGLPFVITGDTKLAALPGPAPSATVDGYTVSRHDGIAHLIAGRSALLRFEVASASGARPDLEPHLGALAHVSAVEVRTQALQHVHASGDAATATLVVHLRFPNRGEQRLFLEFKIAGQIHRAEFTVFVT